jgi:hypothetical protein
VVRNLGDVVGTIIALHWTANCPCSRNDGCRRHCLAILYRLIADRHFATQKVLAVLHGLGAIFLFLAASQSLFGPIYVLVLLYAGCYMPTLALTNSLAFRQMRDPKLEFGPIRVLGNRGMDHYWFMYRQLSIGNYSNATTHCRPCFPYSGAIFPDASGHATAGALHRILAEVSFPD